MAGYRFHFRIWKGFEPYFYGREATSRYGLTGRIGIVSAPMPPALAFLSASDGRRGNIHPPITSSQKGAADGRVKTGSSCRLRRAIETYMRIAYEGVKAPVIVRSMLSTLKSFAGDFFKAPTFVKDPALLPPRRSTPCTWGIAITRI